MSCGFYNRSVGGYFALISIILSTFIAMTVSYLMKEYSTLYFVIYLISTCNVNAIVVPSSLTNLSNDRIKDIKLSLLIIFKAYILQIFLAIILTVFFLIHHPEGTQISLCWAMTLMFFASEFYSKKLKLFSKGISFLNFLCFVFNSNTQYLLISINILIFIFWFLNFKITILQKIKFNTVSKRISQQSYQQSINTFSILVQYLIGNSVLFIIVAVLITAAVIFSQLFFASLFHNSYIFAIVIMVLLSSYASFLDGSIGNKIQELRIDRGRLILLKNAQNNSYKSFINSTLFILTFLSSTIGIILIISVFSFTQSISTIYNGIVILILINIINLIYHIKSLHILNNQENKIERFSLIFLILIMSIIITGVAGIK